MITFYLQLSFISLNFKIINIPNNHPKNYETPHIIDSWDESSYAAVKRPSYFSALVSRSASTLGVVRCTSCSSRQLFGIFPLRGCPKSFGMSFYDVDE